MASDLPGYGTGLVVRPRGTPRKADTGQSFWSKFWGKTLDLPILGPGTLTTNQITGRKPLTPKGPTLPRASRYVYVPWNAGKSIVGGTVNRVSDTVSDYATDLGKSALQPFNDVRNVAQFTGGAALPVLVGIGLVAAGLYAPLPVQYKAGTVLAGAGVGAYGIYRGSQHSKR